MAHNLVSPNELHRAAQDQMLEGRAPHNERDWAKVVNFWAANVDGVEESVCGIMSLLYSCPLSKEIVSQIAIFQAERKGD